MNNHSRTRTESVCSFPCFQNCNQSKLSSSHKTESDHIKLSKLSLKKVIEDDAKTHKFKKSISDKNLARELRCETSRSHKEIQEMMLFKKKNKIENEIEIVDQEMSRLTVKYERSICELRSIKRELERIRQE